MTDEELEAEILRLIALQPQGNKPIARQLGDSINRVSWITKRLEREGIIARDDLMRWKGKE